MARLVLPLVMLVALLYALYFHDQGIVIAEEGGMLAEAEQILRGAVLYRDIQTTPVAPGAWYTTALTLACFGHDLNATRVLMALLFAATAGVVHLLIRDAASTRWALLGVGFLFVQKVLAFPLGNFIWYTEFAVFFALLSVLCLLRYRTGERSAWLAAAGLSMAMCALYKQNVGGALFVGLLVFAGFHARRPRQIAWLLGPASLLGVAVAAAFAWQGALGDALHSVLVLPFTEFRDPYSIAYSDVFSLRKTPLGKANYFPSLFVSEYVFPPRPGAGRLTPWVNALAMALYVAPLLVLGWCAARGLRRRWDATALALLIGALAPFSAAYPRSDFIHVVQSAVGFVPLALYLAASSRWPRSLAATALAALLVVGGFSGLLVWKMPFDTLFEHPKARLKLTAGAARSFDRFLDAVEQEVPKDELVAFLPTGAIFYFLADRPIPWGFTLVITHKGMNDGGAALRDAFEDAGLRYVVKGGIELPWFPRLEVFAPVVQEWLDARFEARSLDAYGLPGMILYERAPRPAG